MNKIIYCLMLDSDGIWIDMDLNKDEFEFKEYYSLSNKNIQIWKGNNKELFILKDVVIK